MGIFSLWRHHLANEAHRRIIARYPQRHAPRPQPKPVTPEEIHQTHLHILRTQLAHAVTAGDNRRIALLGGLLERETTNTPEQRRLRELAHCEGRAATATSVRAKRWWIKRAAKLRRMTTAQWARAEQRQAAVRARA